MTRSFLLGLSLLAAGCGDHPFHEPMKLGGQLVSPETLNHGRDGYQQYCRPCHGESPERSSSPAAPARALR